MNTPLTPLEWARERLANSERIADEKKGPERDGWLEDVYYWQAIVSALSAPSSSLSDPGVSIQGETPAHKTDTRVDRVPGVGQGDLPGRATGDK